MKLHKLSHKYLWSRPLNTLLNIGLFGLGMAIVFSLILFSGQFDNQLKKNISGVDLVLGAKGSPLQIVLSSIFHTDFPTGNINLAEAELYTKSKMIKHAVPLALGDSYRTYRIVGTSPEYLEQFDLKVKTGRMWVQPFEAVIGVTAAEALGLKLGDQFESQHGINEEGEAHEHHPFTVVGIIAKSSKIPDQLLLTSIQSIWAVHEKSDRNADADYSKVENNKVDSEQHGHEHSHDHDHDVKSEPPPLPPKEQQFSYREKRAQSPSHLVPGLDWADADSSLEITNVLLDFSSPRLGLTMPAYINKETNMQAASPAFEAARLFKLVGAGIEALKGFGWLILIVALLSNFIALYNSLKDRKYDLALMRTLGYSKIQLFLVVLMEGLAIAFLGVLLGWSTAHLGIGYASSLFLEKSAQGFTGAVFYFEELILVGIAMLTGFFSAIFPAIQVFRTDIADTLARA